MNSWRYMVIRIGERCPEYGNHMDPEAHIETCCGILWRELEQSGDEVLLLLINVLRSFHTRVPSMEHWWAC